MDTNTKKPSLKLRIRDLEVAEQEAKNNLAQLKKCLDAYRGAVPTITSSIGSNADEPIRDLTLVDQLDEAIRDFNRTNHEMTTCLDSLEAIFIDEAIVDQACKIGSGT